MESEEKLELPALVDNYHGIGSVVTRCNLVSVNHSVAAGSENEI